MSNELSGKRLAFLVANAGVEQVELTSPWQAVADAGGEPILVAPEKDIVQAVNGDIDKGDTFDHRRTSAERIVAEATSWGVIGAPRAEALVGETLAALNEAIETVEPPKDLSSGLVAQLHWNARRLLTGDEISEPKR
jgi:putative intracellular protease/amidase